MSSRVLQTHLSFTWVRYGSHHWFIYGDEFKLNQYSIIYSLFTKCFALKKYEVFISSNLALLRKFTSGQSDQGSVHKLPTWFPLRLLLFKWPAPPLPPPPIINQFSMVRPLYSVIDYLYPLHFPSWKPSDPLKILQNPPLYPGDKSRLVALDKWFDGIVLLMQTVLLETSSFSGIGDRVLNCSVLHQNVISVSYSASNKAVNVFNTRLRNELNSYSTIRGCYNSKAVTWFSIWESVIQ